MNDPLDHVIYFVGSGLAFFAGASCVLLAVALSFAARGRALSLVRNLAALLGAILVAVSAAPLEWWVYASAGVLTCGWLALEWRKTPPPKRALAVARFAVLAVWLLALDLELPHHLAPALPALDKPTLFLIGDSISAGVSDAEKGTWPRLLARQHDVDVRDFSRAGATVKSARKQAERLGDETGLVLLEIGGNDLLGTTPADQFEEQLDLLLADVCRAGRTVVMLALPLPPLANRFGLTQRRLARKYGVTLVPQRVLVGLLTTSGATTDGIHLTARGHQGMADAIWELIGPAYERANPSASR
jgi:acyl-CoA thioesterase-1